MARIAPLLFVFLWSTGFVGAKYGLPYADPFIFLSVRVFIASFILFAIAFFRSVPIAIGRTAIQNSALIGFFLHACYLGGVFFAISQGLPAGVAALVTSLQPVLVSAIARRLFGEELRKSQVVGLGLGFIGLILVLAPMFSLDIALTAYLGVIVALIGSTSATLLQKKIGSTIPLLSGTAYQYLASGAVLAVAAVVTGGTTIQWSAKFIYSFIWLIVGLSVGAILVLLWLLNTSTTASVSSLFYLVPPATAIEAYFLFGETLSLQGLCGVAITAFGVWLVIKSTN